MLESTCYPQSNHPITKEKTDSKSLLISIRQPDEGQPRNALSDRNPSAPTTKAPTLRFCPPKLCSLKPCSPL